MSPTKGEASAMSSCKGFIEKTTVTAGDFKMNSSPLIPNVNPCQSAQVFRLPTALTIPVKQPRIRRPDSVACLVSYRQKRSEASVRAAEKVGVHQTLIAKYEAKLTQSVFELADEQRQSYLQLISGCKELMGEALQKVN